MSPGRRPKGMPSITRTPMAAIPRPKSTSNLPMFHADQPQRTRRTGASNKLDPRKKVSNFERRRVGRIGSMRRVALDRLRELLADRAGLRVGRIGCAHECAPFLDGIG